MSDVRIGIVAASSIVPKVELDDGVALLREQGFDVRVSPQVYERRFIYAGDHAARAQAFDDAARDPEIDVMWMARGGYGAARILPLLEQWTDQYGVPRPAKLLVGYSDVTVLHEYVRNRWGWRTLHAPMPAEANFGKYYNPAHWQALLDLVRRKPPAPGTWGKVRWLVEPTADVEAEVIGGNLSLWASITGTFFAPGGAGRRILFLEDLGEKYYRIDRMVTQLVQAKLIEGAAAIVLGDFSNCEDDPVKMVRGERPGEQVPLRPKIEWDEAVAEIFSKLGVPAAVGLPVGHGPNFAPLPLGARYRIGLDGNFELVKWDWLEQPDPFSRGLKLKA